MRDAHLKQSIPTGQFVRVKGLPAVVIWSPLGSCELGLRTGTVSDIYCRRLCFLGGVATHTKD
jgi:hypothetical protein